MPNLVEYRCKTCGKPFKAEYRKKLRLFCSLICFWKHRGLLYKEARIKQQLTCLVCGQKFQPKRKGAKFCSLQCAGKQMVDSGKASQQGKNNIKYLLDWNKINGVWNKKSKLHRICPICQKGFKIFPYKETEGKGKYCSVKCYRIATWSPDRKEQAIIRGQPEYKAWRKAIFERDKYTCQQCGQSPGWVEAHHLAPFMLHHKAMLKLEYGVTLCRPCHYKVHGRKVKDTKNAI